MGHGQHRPCLHSWSAWKLTVFCRGGSGWGLQLRDGVCSSRMGFVALGMGSVALGWRMLSPALPELQAAVEGDGVKQWPHSIWQDGHHIRGVAQALTHP